MHFLVLKSQRCYSSLIGMEVQKLFPKAWVHCVEDASGALRICAKHPIQLAIVGARTEALDGLDYLPKLIASPYPRQIVVLTERKDQRLLAFFEKHKLDGFIDANTEDPHSVNKALQKVMQGERYRSKSLIPEIQKARRQQSLLSETEQRVLSVLGAAVDNATAGLLLGVSEHTARTHRNRIQNKLNIASKADLIHYAMDNYYTRISSNRIQFPGFEEQLDRSVLPRGDPLR
ncbi:MAG: response regulator transcription factor [Opitutales bacterium]|nr:response regulator transcription factor [Opitutales bacterium]